jgi:hypothetical protein
VELWKTTLGKGRPQKKGTAKDGSDKRESRLWGREKLGHGNGKANSDLMKNLLCSQAM